MKPSRSKLPTRDLLTMLAGAWRQSPAGVVCSEAELENIVPLLRASGVAALCWRRIRSSSVSEFAAAATLHNLYRANILRAVLIRQTIEQVVTHLRSFDIEPMLIKGLAAALLYPDEALRPYGDIDLCVSREQLRAADQALRRLPQMRYEVDLHAGFATLGGGSFHQIYARSKMVRLGDSNVRVPGPEDHLRILCIHFLREGGWRPLWLCDIAAAVEARPTHFDWEYCLGTNPRQAQSIICAIRVAAELLGAVISDTPAATTKSNLPRWLIPAILKEWGSAAPSMSRRHRAPMASHLRYPFGFVGGLRDRWPNPLEATVHVGGPFNDFPRLPFQVGSCVARLTKFAARLPTVLRQH